MKIDFSGDDILIHDFDELEAYKIGRKIEQDGIYFYTRMKDEMLKSAVRDVIERLITDERRHLEAFDEKVQELCRKRKIEDEGDSLADIVDSKVMDVLRDSDRVADILCNPQEAIRLGMAVERRSIAFYKRILEKTEEKSGRAAIEALIQEEEKHLEELSGLLKK